MQRSILIISQQCRTCLPFKILRRTNTSQNEKNKKLKYTRLAVDRSGLLGISNNKYNPYDKENSAIKETLSPLAKDLLSYIELRGPITVHDYMSQCLNHLLHGYYQQKKEKELIGIQGDFITSPEITQLFGELIGIWCISMWKSMNEPQKVNLIELGPGKGTLMKDILRVIEKFPLFKNVVNIYLIELSQTLRVKQYNQFNTINDMKTDINNNTTTNIDTVTKQTIIDSHCYQTTTGINIHWHSFLNQVPSDVPAIIIGQEFLDAFPVHQFTYTEKGWREKLVDINRSANNKQESSSKVINNEVKDINSILNNISKKEVVREEVVQSSEETSTSLDHTYHFRFVISPTETPAVKSLVNNSNSNIISQRNNTKQTTTATTTSSITTEESEAVGIQQPSTLIPPVIVGDSLEISPLAIAMCEDIAIRVVKSGGAALLIDYGENFTQGDSIRAFKNHKQIHVLSQVCYNYLIYYQL